MLSKIDYYVWVSDYHSAEDVDDLKKNYINTVINMTVFPHNPEIYKGTDIIQFNCPISDCVYKNIIGTAGLINKLIKKHRFSGNVLVHCARGKSRGVAAVMYYMMLEYNISPSIALKMIQSTHTIAEPNSGFYEQLVAYNDTRTKKIPNHLKKMISEISSDIFISNYKLSTYSYLLKHYGITDVINVTNEPKNKLILEEYKQYNITEHQFAVSDTPNSNIIKIAMDVHKLIKSLNKKILVHCHAGISRSASVVIWHLMMTQNIDYKIAYNQVASKRPVINPNYGFCEQLKAAYLMKKFNIIDC